MKELRLKIDGKKEYRILIEVAGKRSSVVTVTKEGRIDVMEVDGNAGNQNS